MSTVEEKGQELLKAVATDNGKDLSNLLTDPELSTFINYKLPEETDDLPKDVTPLGFAIILCLYSPVEKLIKKGADINNVAGNKDTGNMSAMDLVNHYLKTSTSYEQRQRYVNLRDVIGNSIGGYRKSRKSRQSRQSRQSRHR